MGNLNRPGLRFNVEVAAAEIENRGRTPVTVQKIALDVGHAKIPRRKRQTLSFNFLDFEGFETRGKVRLEAHDSVKYILNASHAIWAIRQTTSGAFSIRATAQVTGKRAANSSWWRRWKISEKMPSRLWLDEPFDLALEIYRLLYRFTDGAESSARLVLPERSMAVADWIETNNDVGQDDLSK